jgi:hypothetical protein
MVGQADWVRPQGLCSRVLTEQVQVAACPRTPQVRSFLMSPSEFCSTWQLNCAHDKKRAPTMPGRGSDK